LYKLSVIAGKAKEASKLSQLFFGIGYFKIVDILELGPNKPLAQGTRLGYVITCFPDKEN